jgi:hypothetical protein
MEFETASRRIRYNGIPKTDDAVGPSRILDCLGLGTGGMWGAGSVDTLSVLETKCHLKPHLGPVEKPVHVKQEGEQHR